MSSDSAGSSSADLDMLGVQVSSWWLTTLGNTCQVKKKCLKHDQVLKQVNAGYSSFNDQKGLHNVYLYLCW